MRAIRVLTMMAAVLTIVGCITAQSQSSSDTISEAEKERLRQYYRQKNQANMKARIDSIKAHTNWSESDRQMIIDGKIRLGMTEEQVEMSLGGPLTKRDTQYTWGTMAQWEYRTQYLYFKNGILETIQDR